MFFSLRSRSAKLPNTVAVTSKPMLVEQFLEIVRPFAVILEIVRIHFNPGEESDRNSRKHVLQ
jgi:hypothetical protein